MKRSVLVQIKHLPKNPQGKQFPAEWFVFQLLCRASVDRCNQFDAATARLPERHNVLWLRDFVNCNHCGFMLRSSWSIPSPFGQPESTSVRRPKIKLRHTMHRSRQFLPFIHNGHALSDI